MKSGIMTMIMMPLTAMALTTVPLTGQQWGQERLRRILCYGCEPSDTPDDTPDVPLRNRDALKEFSLFMSRSGWSTNQFITGLMFEMTNNLQDVGSLSYEQKRIVGTAAWKLSEINHPSVTNFFRMCNANPQMWCKRSTILGMFRYTNLEPEVMAYMRTLSVQTNIYDRVADNVMIDMFETLETMPDEMKPAATNQLAKYLYFAAHHVTESQAWHDRELANFIPSYSNSVQRLDLMRHVANTATNIYERTNAVNVVNALSQLPTNQVNNVSWMVDE